MTKTGALNSSNFKVHKLCAYASPEVWCSQRLSLSAASGCDSQNYVQRSVVDEDGVSVPMQSDSSSVLEFEWLNVDEAVQRGSRVVVLFLHFV